MRSIGFHRAYQGISGCWCVVGPEEHDGNTYKGFVLVLGFVGICLMWKVKG
jgi:hypothetical protein